MTITEQLKSLLPEIYLDENGYEYCIQPENGLTEEEISSISRRLPTGQLPADIKELLRFTRGFEFNAVIEITFDGIGQFGFENLFPHSVQLAHDGLGNFWILDINSKGQWGKVFYVSHDPAVVVVHSHSLSQFLEHIDEYGKFPVQSNLYHIHEKTVFDVWRVHQGFMVLEDARHTDDQALSNFALSLPDNYLIADLRHKPAGAGFAWGRHNPELDGTVKCPDELIWGIPRKSGQNFFTKLFRRSGDKTIKLV
ncbi:SMI1/KNR4 family protein [Chitinophaga solisilvae]|uniref:SMI1/KNR4 family protein n=1 Tax=Chitinophaga solisilvae TaxID=1233460 RepID=A0A433WGD9_9BACT|nr:SMI1/KNR4 family protein [Chitinophaga solisilvae]NSL88793.1 SMI1/KNR4 family protein [Chitinophaga solisilvae]